MVITPSPICNHLVVDEELTIATFLTVTPLPYILLSIGANLLSQAVLESILPTALIKAAVVVVHLAEASLLAIVEFSLIALSIGVDVDALAVVVVVPPLAKVDGTVGDREQTSAISDGLIEFTNIEGAIFIINLVDVTHTGESFWMWIGVRLNSCTMVYFSESRNCWEGAPVSNRLLLRIK